MIFTSFHVADEEGQKVDELISSQVDKRLQQMDEAGQVQGNDDDDDEDEDDGQSLNGTVTNVLHLVH